VILLLPFSALEPRLQFEELARRCAPTAPIMTLRSAVAAQSNFDPLSITIHDSQARPERQPKSTKEAIHWVRWLVSHGHAVSIGLMQLHIEHVAGLQMSLESAFDPCQNLAAGWKILSDKYRMTTAILGPGEAAVEAALASYNRGTLIGGITDPQRPLSATTYLNTLSTEKSPPEPPLSAPEPPPSAPREGRKQSRYWDLVRARTPWLEQSRFPP
jgi:hypothetical protein